jgi:hypothetical protein
VSSIPSIPTSKRWRELYSAALFENDKDQLAKLIPQARAAAVLRGRELFNKHQAECKAERQDLENALYFLSLLERVSGRKGRLAA